MTNYFRKGKSLYASTSNTFSTGEGETITPASVSGLPTDTEITLTFDRVDSSGTATPTKLERIIGTISGGNFVVSSGGRGADGTTEQAHTSPVVEYIFNAKDLNDMVSGFLVQHLTTGAHNNITASNITASSISINGDSVPTASSTTTFTNKTLTSPKLNENVVLSATATQLNALTTLTSDGWTAATGTWTYASASTITVPSGAASIYQKGDRIKLTQTTAKYFVIVTVADTLLTVTGGTDYTVANAAITSPYYSHQINPVGYPTWFDWTPSWSCSGSMSISAGTVSRKQFKVDGASCTIAVNYSAFTLGGSAATSILFTLPVNFADSVSEFNSNTNACPIVDGGTSKIGKVNCNSTTQALVQNTNVSNWTLGTTNSYIMAMLTYEI